LFCFVLFYDFYCCAGWGTYQIYHTWICPLLPLSFIPSPHRPIELCSQPLNNFQYRAVFFTSCSCWTIDL
jgi:hypothetical protein